VSIQTKLFQTPQRLPRRKYVRAAGRGLQPQSGEQRGQETTDQAVAGEQVVEVGVGRGPRCRVNGLNRSGELLPGHSAPDRGPHRGQAARRRVEQNLHSVAELRGGQVERWQGPQSFPAASTVGAGEEAAQELVEQVQYVVAGRGL
jgi:hypothetical protein